MPRAVIASRSDADVDLRDPLDPRVRPSYPADPVVVREAPAPYPRTARMTTPAEFDRCLRRPPLHRNGAFALHLAWVDGAPNAWRLGLVVPKRYEATAVGRNTVKRRWRDAFRLCSSAWAGEFGSADLVVRLQAPLVPKVKSVVVKGGKRRATQPPSAANAPAKVRARERFDPAQVLDGFVERLRARGGRPSGAAAP